MIARIWFGALLFCLTTTPATADPVAVTAGQEIGAGYTVNNGSRCFLVTPLHVLREKLGDGQYDDATGGNFTVYDANGTQASGRISQEFKDFDLAVGEIPKPGPLACPKSWSDGSRLTQMLKPRVALTLTQVGTARSVVTMSANLRETTADTHIMIEPARSSDTFQKGLSGSLIEIGGVPAGILLEVDTKRGLGKVLRQNQINALIGSMVTEPRGNRIRIAIAPFERNRAELPIGTVAALRAVNQIPKFQAYSVAGTGKFEGLTIYGTLLRSERTTQNNPNYVKPSNPLTSSNNAVGTIVGIFGGMLKRGGSTVKNNVTSSRLIKLDFEIQWKIIRGDGAIVYQDVDTRNITVGEESYVRNITEDKLTGQVITESLIGVLSSLN